MLGILSAVLSFFTVFSTNVQAAQCFASLQCAATLISCTGDNGCEAGDTGGGYVKCQNAGGLTIIKYCPAKPPKNGE
jgi:hypothetical protein